MHKRKALILLFVIVVGLFVVYFSSITSSITSIPDSPATAKSEIPKGNTSNLTSDKVEDIPLRAHSPVQIASIQGSDALPDDYIKECSNESIKKKQKKLDKKLNTYLKVIEQSDIHDDQLSYLLLNKSKRNIKRVERLKKLFNIMPTSPTIIKNILAECLRNSDDSLCNNAIYEKAETIGGKYASVLMQLAALRYQQEDFSKSKQLLRKAINRTTYNEPPYEFKTLIDNNLLLHGSFTDLERLLLTAFQNPSSSIYPIIELCENAITDDKEYVDLCLSAGKLVEKTADTHINNILGIALQINVYKKISEQNGVTKLQKEFKEQNAFFQNQEFIKATMLAFHDEDLLRDWLFMMEQGTEKLAAEALIKDAKLLSKNPDYDPCSIEQE
ncbi:hypothetical protein Q4489_07200 [Thalassotalea sp. 1_MG-2023]|uniref:hypothetical protein n=1 Tax=Thalassotalea sp. 1_MG-2023 TaxID=3062680 RepID=UPI0026E289E0|nr:hypothetical protein [Thalassotalea sp. 1_MG-2023]MDO6426793.1 hypothetical protein [Thalassotalea sp. 1_MG-2023]